MNTCLDWSFQEQASRQNGARRKQLHDTFTLKHPTGWILYMISSCPRYKVLHNIQALYVGTCLTDIFTGIQSTSVSYIYFSTKAFIKLQLHSFTSILCSYLCIWFHGYVSSLKSHISFKNTWHCTCYVPFSYYSSDTTHIHCFIFILFFICHQGDCWD